MGRIPRFQEAGMYHLMSRSSAEERIFRMSDDYTAFLKLLGTGRLRCHLFCILRTHYHVLATIDDDDKLAGEMHRLNRRYAVGFNRRHGRRGRVFDRPYTSVPVQEESHLVWVTRYIAQNPTRPGDWRWSSILTEYDFVDTSPLVDVFGSERRMREFALAP